MGRSQVPDQLLIRLMQKTRPWSSTLCWMLIVLTNPVCVFFVWNLPLTNHIKNQIQSSTSRTKLHITTLVIGLVCFCVCVWMTVRPPQHLQRTIRLLGFGPHYSCGDAGYFADLKFAIIGRQHAVTPTGLALRRTAQRPWCGIGENHAQRLRFFYTLRGVRGEDLFGARPRSHTQPHTNSLSHSSAESENASYKQFATQPLLFAT